MQQVGTLAEKGFSLDDLKKIKTNFEKINCECELIDLSFQQEDENKENIEAAILVVRKGVDKILESDSDKMFKELLDLEWDKKAKMRGKVLNKHARWNLCFDEFEQAPDYEDGKGTIVAFDSVPLTKKVKASLKDLVGEKANKLVAEGNYYYDVEKCYIGYHGDAERRIVIGVRLGETFPLHFQWYFKSQEIGERKTIQLNCGDIYFTSDIAVGWNWLKRNIPTLRHSAGTTKIKKSKK